MKKRFCIVTTIVTVASFLSLITASVAWFESRTDVSFGYGRGSTQTSFFAGGDGRTEDTAYVIALPVHLYNMAWLQYLGQFNTTLSPTYFKLANDIDMSGFGSALPPIGTQTNPFIGIFNGYGHTISGLVVSNKIEDLTKKPSSINAVSGLSVVGFFGIVGDPDPIGLEKGDGLTYTDRTLDIFNTTELSDFNLENITIKSNTTQTLMGVVAGYVNAEDGHVHDVGVYNGSLQSASGATGLTSMGNIISKFSLVGETKDTVWQEAYNDDGTGGGGQGSGAAFGGSLDMRELSRRIAYIQGSDSTTITGSGSSYTATNSGFGFNVKFTPSNSRQIYTWNISSRSNQADFIGDSCFPININKVDMGLEDVDGNITINEINGAATLNTKTLVTNTVYKTATSETMNDQNAGYFVGTDTTNRAIRVRSGVYNTSTSIAKSLGVDSASSTTVYDSSKFEIASIDATGGFRIKDDYNSALTTTKFAYNRTKTVTDSGFVNYKKVRDYIHSMLSDAKKTIHGFRLSESPSAGNTLSKTVNLFGQTKNSYTLYRGAVNFSLKEAGTVTVACGTYASSTTTANHNMAGIYTVNRENGTGPTEISNVYKSADGAVTFNQTTAPAGSTKVYDSTWYNNNLYSDAVYYAEIPLPKGDYLLARSGNASDDSGSLYAQSAYMLYLDIGASGGGGGGGETPIGSYILNNVRYVHSLDAELPDSPEYLDILFEITTGGAGGASSLYFSRPSATMLYYYQNGAATDVALRVFFAKTSNIDNNPNAVWDA